MEIAVYEPCRGAGHSHGEYAVGVQVPDPPTDVGDLPEGLVLRRLGQQSYATVRGATRTMDSLHTMLTGWLQERDLLVDPHGRVVETYHPVVDGPEEVRVHLPVMAAPGT